MQTNALAKAYVENQSNDAIDANDYVLERTKVESGSLAVDTDTFIILNKWFLHPTMQKRKALILVIELVHM